MRLPLETRLALPLLSSELTAAGVPHSGLGSYEEPDALVLHTYDSGGVAQDLPPEAEPVVLAHEAPPAVIEHVLTQTVGAIVRTTDAQLHEVFRLPTVPKRLYRGTFSMMAVDAVSGDSKDVEARLSFRQQAGAAVQVGSTVVLSTIQAASASSWAIQGGASGSDFLVSVRGAAGRSIDWALSGDILAYGPEGVS